MVYEITHFIQRQYGFSADSSVGAVPTDIQQFGQLVSKRYSGWQFAAHLFKKGGLNVFLVNHLKTAKSNIM